MWKRSISLLVTIMVLLAALPIVSLAENWTCPNCGYKNSLNFCPNCGTAKPKENVCPTCGTVCAEGSKFCYQCGTRLTAPAPTAEPTAVPTAVPTPKPTAVPTQQPTKAPTPKPTAVPTIAPTEAPQRVFEITSVTRNANGSVTIRWKDSQSSGPYMVHYECMVSDDYNNDLQQDQLLWNSGNEVYSNSAKECYLAPGVGYYIIVEDKGTDEVTPKFVFQPDVPDNYPQFTITTDMELKRGTNGLIAVNNFSASDIEQNIDIASYGAYIKLDYPQLKTARVHFAQIAIRDPYGSYIVTSYEDDMTFNSGNSYVYWNNYDLTWYLSKILKQYDSIPTGSYTWYLFLEGDLASSTSFVVTP